MARAARSTNMCFNWPSHDMSKFVLRQAKSSIHLLMFILPSYRQLDPSVISYHCRSSIICSHCFPERISPTNHDILYPLVDESSTTCLIDSVSVILKDGMSGTFRYRDLFNHECLFIEADMYTFQLLRHQGARIHQART